MAGTGNGLRLLRHVLPEKEGAGRGLADGRPRRDVRKLVADASGPQLLSSRLLQDEFDQLLERLKTLETEYPELITPDSPTQRIGGKATSLKPFKHTVALMSLDNSYSLDDLKAFTERCEKLAEGRKLEYVAELKIDGLSVALHYESGVLKTGATRGDGATGDEITQNAKTIKTIPLRLKTDAPPHAEVRGEVFISRSQFKRINADLEMQGEKTFANARNSASGTLRMLDSAIVTPARWRMFAA